MEFFFQTEVRERFERLMASGGRKTASLYDTLREAIMSGRVPLGTRLPSTRRMAEAYGLSRGAVNTVYDMLAAEGYVEAATGRGTFAALRGARLNGGGRGEEEANAAQLPLSDWAMRLPPIPERVQDTAVQPEGMIDLRPGEMDPLLFPAAEWKRAVYAEIREMTGRQYEDAFNAQGHRPLREAIARHLVRERGIEANPGQVFVTNGSMQAIALLAMLLVGEGDSAIVENPGYSGISRAVRAAGGKAVPAIVDRDGIVPADWDARLLFVTPSRQFPTGAVLPLERRLRLIEWASARQAVIIEDDYDSEFRFGGRPVEPLKTLDREGRVVYIGTFSRTMMTDLRIGYAVVPDSLAEPMRRAKFLVEPHPPAIAEQRSLARFMAEGGYGRHLRRMQRVCGRRLALLRSGLEAACRGRFELGRTDAGLQLFARWRGEPASYEALKRIAWEEGVRWEDASRFWLGGDGPASALFGFAHLDDSRLAEAGRRLERAFAKLEGLG